MAARCSYLLIALSVGIHCSSAGLINPDILDGLINSGWWKHGNMEDIESSAFNDQLQKYREYHGLNDDDNDESDVLAEMEKPRCNKPDQDTQTQRRKKRYTYLNDGEYLWGERGGRMPISIGFKNYWPKMSRSDQEWVALECASRWAEVSGLSFRLVRNQDANIAITFKYFDGPYNSIGSGESPVSFLYGKVAVPSSKLELDSGENWVPTASHGNGLSLEEGLCHEMGHTLSLGHSDDKTSIMFPSIQEGRPRVRLSNDDIRGIQSLYGRFNGQVLVGTQVQSRTTQRPTRKPVTAPPPPTNPPFQTRPTTRAQTTTNRPVRTLTAKFCRQIPNRQQRKQCNKQRRQNNRRNRNRNG